MIMRSFIICLVAACVVGFCAAGVQAEECVQAEEWVIAPSGDPTGVLDADAIEGALRAVAACDFPGTVRLEEGHFWVSRPIQVSGFDGELVGAVKKIKGKEKKGRKKGKTIIEAVRGPGVEFGTIPGPYWGLEEEEHSPIFLFEDNEGSIRIADLTVQILIPNPRDTYLLHGWVETTSLYSFFEIVGGGDFDTAFENVLTRGGKGDYNDRNVIYGVHVMGGGPDYNGAWLTGTWSNGTHEVKNCEFENIATYTYSFSFWWDSDFVVSGSSFTGVDTAIISQINESTDVEISHNKFKTHPVVSTDTIIIYGDMSASVSEVLISKNEFRVSGQAGAINVKDPGFFFNPQKTLDVSIIDNKFQLHKAYWGGIWTDLHGALIKGNKFEGKNSTYGAVVAGINWYPRESRYLPAEGLYIADNDFKKLKSVAHTIWLGEGTSDCVVVDNKGIGDYVLDESASASNTVILD